MVSYVKRNAIAGREFASWSELQAHLQWWMREIADTRVHATTEERPIDRFVRDEQQQLRPIGDQPRYMSQRQLVRKVQTDATVEVDTNHYSVPWKHIGRRVHVVVTTNEVTISFDLEPIAHHKRAQGRKERIINSAHLDGVVRGRQDLIDRLRGQAEDDASYLYDTDPRYSLLRPLSEYDAFIGGGL